MHNASTLESTARKGNICTVPQQIINYTLEVAFLSSKKEEEPAYHVVQQNPHLLGNIFITGLANEREGQYENICSTITQRS